MTTQNFVGAALVSTPFLCVAAIFGMVCGWRILWAAVWRIFLTVVVAAAVVALMGYGMYLLFH